MSDSPKSLEQILQQQGPNDSNGYSDNYWFEAWAEKIEALLKRDRTRVDSLVFRPDQFVRDAMVRYSVDFAGVIGQVEKYLQSSESQFKAFCELHPPIKCSQCSSDNVSIYDNVWDCLDCGTLTKIPQFRQHDIEACNEVFNESLFELARIIRVAAVSIESKKEQRQERIAPKLKELQAAIQSLSNLSLVNPPVIHVPQVQADARKSTKSEQDSQKPKKDDPRNGMTSEQMMETLLDKEHEQYDPEVRGWSASKFAIEIQRSPTSVKITGAWKRLQKEKGEDKMAIRSVKKSDL